MTRRGKVQSLKVEIATLMSVALATFPMPPRLTISGTDKSGIERNAELILDEFYSMPDQEAWIEYMRISGKEAASLKPYISRIKALGFFQKGFLDLHKAGFGKDEQVIVVSGIELPSVKKETMVFLPLGHDAKHMGFRTIKQKYYELDGTARVYAILQAFLDSYTQHSPKLN